MKSSAAQKNPARDGRHARSERTRAAVAKAMLECIMAGSPRPTAEEIAARAGVSSRAVFRHFDNLEALLEEVAQQQITQVTQALPPIVLEGTLEQRIGALAENSACRNEIIAPVRRAVFASYGASSQFKVRHAWLSGVVRKQVQKVFRSELDHLPANKRAARVAAIRALLSFSYWNALREHEGLSKECATQSLRDTVKAILISD
jgi:TetR/AcrR family transcriptional regulator, regulator of autoinduction and epiphytic fitness